jgi:hypothetical protein
MKIKNPSLLVWRLSTRPRFVAFVVVKAAHGTRKGDVASGYRVTTA